MVDKNIDIEVEVSLSEDATFLTNISSNQNKSKNSSLKYKDVAYRLNVDFLIWMLVSIVFSGGSMFILSLDKNNSCSTEYCSLISEACFNSSPTLCTCGRFTSDCETTAFGSVSIDSYLIFVPLSLIPGFIWVFCRTYSSKQANSKDPFVSLPRKSVFTFFCIFTIIITWFSWSFWIEQIDRPSCRYLSSSSDCCFECGSRGVDCSSANSESNCKCSISFITSTPDNGSLNQNICIPEGLDNEDVSTIGTGSTTLNFAALWALIIGLISVGALYVSHTTSSTRLNSLNQTPLHIATTKKQIERALALGIDPNAKDSFQQTALHRAIETANFNLIRALLVHPSIDTNIEDPEGLSLLHIVTKYGQWEILKLLLVDERIEVNRTEVQRGWTALHFAVRYAGTDAVSALIQDPRVDVNYRALDGVTPLHIAAKSGKVKSLELLLRHSSIDVNAEDKNGWSILHHAASSASSQATLVINTLLADDRVDIESRALNGWTALHAAVRFGTAEVVGAMVDFVGSEGAHVNVNAKGKSGWTPIALAARYRTLPVLSALLKNENIDVNDKNVDNWTPLHLAARYGREPALIEALLGHSSIDPTITSEKGWNGLHIATRYSSAAYVRAFLKDGRISPSTPTDNGINCLHIAVKYGEEEVISELLLDPRVDINEKDNEGNDVLSLAAKNDRIEVMKVLLKGNSAFTLQISKVEEITSNTDVHTDNNEEDDKDGKDDKDDDDKKI